MNFNSTWAFLCYIDMVLIYRIKQKLPLRLAQLSLWTEEFVLCISFFFFHLQRLLYGTMTISLVVLFTGKNISLCYPKSSLYLAKKGFEAFLDVLKPCILKWTRLILTVEFHHTFIQNLLQGCKVQTKKNVKIFIFLFLILVWECNWLYAFYF